MTYRIDAEQLKSLYDGALCAINEKRYNTNKLAELKAISNMEKEK